MARGKTEKTPKGSLAEDIRKKQIRRVYLIYGEEAYMRQSLKKALREAVVGTDDMNFLYLEGKNTDPRAIMDAAETMPFFADRRLILAENTGLFKKDAGGLPDFVKNIPETACIAFVETEVDKRSRLFKAVSEQGLAEECVRQTKEVLEGWVVRGLAQSGKKISRGTLNLFLEMTGNDMETIRWELEKLITYTGSREVVTEADVRAITTQQITEKIFEMVDAIGLRQQQRALNLYNDLYALKESPSRILYLIAQQMHTLLQVREMTDRRRSIQEIMSRTGWWYKKADGLIQQSRRFTKEELKRFLGECMELSEAVRKGNIGDSLAVEMLIVKLTAQES